MERSWAPLWRPEISAAQATIAALEEVVTNALWPWVEAPSRMWMDSIFEVGVQGDPPHAGVIMLAPGRNVRATISTVREALTAAGWRTELRGFDRDAAGITHVEILAFPTRSGTRLSPGQSEPVPYEPRTPPDHWATIFRLLGCDADHVADIWALPEGTAERPVDPDAVARAVAAIEEVEGWPPLPDNEPIAESVAHLVRTLVLVELLPAGRRLPSPAQIAQRYDVAVDPVRRAMFLLVDEGVLVGEGPLRDEFLVAGGRPS